MARRVTNVVGWLKSGGSRGGRNVTKKNKTSKRVTSDITVIPAMLDTNPASTAGALGSIVNGAYRLDFFFTNSFALTVVKSGTVVVGTGTAGQVSYWSDANTLAAANLKVSGSNVLTVAADYTATLTVPFTGRAHVAKVSGLAASAAISMDWNSGSYFTLTPNQTATITPSNGFVGQKVTLVILTSGTSSYTLTFGGNFKSAGTLATGTSTGKYFVLEFIYTGTNYLEVSRKSAL